MDLNQELASYAILLLLLCVVFLLLRLSQYFQRKAKFTAEKRQVTVVLREANIDKHSVVRQLPYYALDPVNPHEGFMWYNTTDNCTKAMCNGAVVAVDYEQVHKAKSHWRFFFDNNLNAL